MTRLLSHCGRALALAATLTATLAGAAQPAVAAPAAPHDATALSLTEADVAASNAKVRGAYDQLTVMWRDGFAQLGARFVPPDLVRYRGGVRTSCGVMRAGNASYCLNDNTIYFDEVFVAAQAKDAARALGTDGDMTAVGIIAHEMGHAVAMQLGHASRATYRNESTADCLAGAFAQYADRQGSLEAGDLDEAFYGMSRAGDPTPELTGDQRVDRAILVRASVMGHGTDAQRMQNFRTGLNGGAGACLAEFRGA